VRARYSRSIRYFAANILLGCTVLGSCSLVNSTRFPDMTPVESVINPTVGPSTTGEIVSGTVPSEPAYTQTLQEFQVTQSTNSYYVSPTGSDQNPGTFTKPWKTIQKAANTLAPGETVYIRGGTYYEQVRLEYRDNKNGPYSTFINYPGETVILDGTGIEIKYGEGLFHIKMTGYIRVSGLIIQHSNGAGIYAGYSNHLLIDHNLTYDTVTSGIGIWNGTNVVVDNNEVTLACNPHPGYSAAEENITVAANSSNVEVKNNLVHKAANIPNGYSGGEGINVKDGSHDIRVHHNIVHLDERSDGLPPNRLAFGLDAWQHETYNVSFDSNIAYNNGHGFVIESERGGTARDISVINNIAYNNGTGFTIPNWVQNEISLKKNIQFVNNTSYKNTTGFDINSVKIETIIIQNNISWQDGTFLKIGEGVPKSQILSDHNLLSRDPLFLNADGFNFHLQNGSPAIDTGTASYAPSLDFDGKMRPQGDGFDIGVFEFTGVIP